MTGPFRMPATTRWRDSGAYRATPRPRDLDAELAAWAAVFAAFDPDQPRNPHTGEWIHAGEIFGSLTKGKFTVSPDIKPEDRDRIEGALAHIPEPVRKQIAPEISGIHIQKSIRERGFRGEILGRYRSDGVLEITPVDGAEMTAVHETMHALDSSHFNIGQFSESPEWKSLVDWIQRETPPKHIAAYYDPKYRPHSLREIFAELGAQYFLGEPLSLDTGKHELPPGVSGEIKDTFRDLFGEPVP